MEASSDHALRLPPDKVRVLKKTLYFYSRQYTEERANDIFVVSWDISDIGHPPDDLGPVLPPPTWQQPCALVFGLQGVRPEAAADWAAVFDSSMKAYAGDDYVHLMPSGYVFSNGCMTLIYVDWYLHRFTHGIAVDTAVGASVPAVGVRFGLHQAVIAVLNIAVPSLVDDADETEHADVGAPARVAMVYQLFYTAISRFSFAVNGQREKVKDCPITIFLGCKDYEAAVHENFGISSVDGAFYSLAEEYPVMNRLRRSDMRISPKATGNVGSTKYFGGSVGVVKTGVLRLIIQNCEGDGKVARPEVTVFKFLLPTADLERLPPVYRKVWRLLTDEADLRSSINVTPNAIDVPFIRPYQPFHFQLRLKNTSRLPAVFSVLCLSQAHRDFVPLAQHSQLVLSARGLRRRDSDRAAGGPATADGRGRAGGQSRVSGGSPKETAGSSGGGGGGTEGIGKKWGKFKAMISKAAASTNLGLMTARGSKPGFAYGGRQSSAVPTSGGRDRNHRSNTGTAGYASQPSQDQGTDGDPFPSARRRWAGANLGELEEGDEDARSSTIRHQDGSGDRQPTGRDGEYEADEREEYDDEDDGRGDSRGGLSPGRSDGSWSRSSASSSASSPRGLRPPNPTATDRKRSASTPPIVPSLDMTSLKKPEYKRPNVIKNFGANLPGGGGAPGIKVTRMDGNSPDNQRSDKKASSIGGGGTRGLSENLLSVPPGGEDTQRRSSVEYVGPSGGGGPQSNRATQQFDLARWLDVKPPEGVVLPGRELVLSVKLEVKDAVMKPTEVPGLLLAVRLDDCACDSFFGLSTKLIPSLYGLSLRNLQDLGHNVLVNVPGIPPLLDPLTDTAARENGENGEVKAPSSGDINIQQQLDVDANSNSTLQTPSRRINQNGDSPSESSTSAATGASRTQNSDQPDPQTADSPQFFGKSSRGEINTQTAEADNNRKAGGASAIPDSPDGGSGAKEFPLPKEVWWLLTFIYQNLASQLAAAEADAAMGEDCTSNLHRPPSEEDVPPFSLQSFLAEILSFEYIDFGARRSMRIVRDCLERGTVIPPQTPLATIFLVLEKWALSLPVALIPPEVVSAISEEAVGDSQHHLICRAVVLSLPTTARNCFISIVSMMRWVLQCHETTMGPDEALELEYGLAEWMSRSLARESAPRLSLPFMTHFLACHAGPPCSFANVACLGAAEISASVEQTA